MHQPLNLLAHAPNAGMTAVAIAGAMETAYAHGAGPGARPRLLLRGLDGEDLALLLDSLFPGARARLPQLTESATADALDEEFQDLFRLLLDASDAADRETRWLAAAVASAALFDNHLWEDLRLPDRRALSVLLNRHFGTLAQRNTGNMRWKAFFYKQLCERAGMVCRAPSCGACDDYALCFGPE